MLIVLNKIQVFNNQVITFILFSYKHWPKFYNYKKDDRKIFNLNIYVKTLGLVKGCLTNINFDTEALKDTEYKIRNL